MHRTRRHIKRTPGRSWRRVWLLLLLICGFHATSSGVDATLLGKKEVGADTQSKGNGRVPGGDQRIEPVPTHLTNVKIWTNPDYTRLSFQFSGVVDFRELPSAPSTAPEPGIRHTPSRLLPGQDEILFEIPNSSLAPEFRQTLAPKGATWELKGRGGLLERVELTPVSPALIRVRLIVKPLKTKTFTRIESPPRLLVDLFGKDLEADVDDPLSALVGELSKKSAAKETLIVVDAGHGGTELGAVGPTGVCEKDVTLAMSLLIREKLLELPGVKVLMTRETDVVVPLAERARVANEHNADLFISIHANASPRSDRHGIETYYLDNASDAAAEKLAASENATLKDKGGLEFIVQDLVVGGNVEYSKRLARAVHEELLASLTAYVSTPHAAPAAREGAAGTVQASGTVARVTPGSVARTAHPPAPAVSRELGIKDLGIKTALFYVLFGAQMPSILLETAFVSNAVEEQRLVDPVYQEKVAIAVREGVRRYTEEARALSTVLERTPDAESSTLPAPSAGASSERSIEKKGERGP